MKTRNAMHIQKNNLKQNQMRVREGANFQGNIRSVELFRNLKSYVGFYKTDILKIQ
jgi:hypothetical protein